MKRDRGEAEGGRILSGKRMFQCRQCNCQFDTFQALGGHTAAHNARSSKASDKTPTIHRCNLCPVTFSSGQALGGHMRKHRQPESSSSSDDVAHSGKIVVFDNAARLPAMAEVHRVVIKSENRQTDIVPKNTDFFFQDLGYLLKNIKTKPKFYNFF